MGVRPGVFTILCLLLSLQHSRLPRNQGGSSSPHQGAVGEGSSPRLRRGPGSPLNCREGWKPGRAGTGTLSSCRRRRGAELLTIKAAQSLVETYTPHWQGSHMGLPFSVCRARSEPRPPASPSLDARLHPRCGQLCL